MIYLIFGSKVVHIFKTYFMLITLLQKISDDIKLFFEFKIEIFNAHPKKLTNL